MKSTIEDICEKLRNKQYANEEHIRFSLVGRILQETGWDIWNPKEVYTEFSAIKSEDNTRVDIALFSRWHNTGLKYPDVFLEIKSHSKIEKDLPAIEKQLRDYNRDNQATFTIITDGQQWLFYYSLTQGKFSDRKYLEINLLTNDQQQIEDEFRMFLSKESITSGEAKNRAEEYLRLSHKERAIRDSLPEAIKRMDIDPLLSKVKAVQIILSENGVHADDGEIITVLKKETLPISPVISPVTPKKSNIQNPALPVPAKPNEPLEAQAFYCKNRAGAYGKGIPCTGGFLVFKGSLFMIQEQPSISKAARNERKKMLAEQILILQGEHYCLTKDHFFKSSSMAVEAILAVPTSGNVGWKTESGTSLKQFKP